jgi:hypothetical protein
MAGHVQFKVSACINEKENDTFHTCRKISGKLLSMEQVPCSQPTKWRIYYECNVLIRDYYVPVNSPSLCEYIYPVQVNRDCLCGLVIRVPGYSSRGPRFDFRRYQISEK